MARTILRRARKTHWCAGCGLHSIKPGDQHLTGTTFPGEDGMGEIKHPVQLRECRACAERYGRGHLFTPHRGEDPMTRTFHLQRDTDVTGVSGTGIVADGVQFPDGTTVLRWHGEYASTVVWSSFEAAIAVHGHDGKTRPVWSDEPAARSLDGEYSPRGFFHWTPTETSYGHKVSVYESSAATAPHMWLQLANPTDEDAGALAIAAHLTADQARTVRDQISAWLERANR